MLPVIVLAVLSNPGSAKLKSSAEVAAFLNPLGFTYKEAGDAGLTGTLSHNGRSVHVWMDFSEGTVRVSGRTLRRDVGGYAKRLRLSTAFDVAWEIRPGFDQPLAIVHLQKNVSYFYPIVGRTVVAYCDVELTETPAAADVKAQLARYWTAVEAYATANGGAFRPARKRDWSRERFSEAVVLKAMNRVSLDRLLQSWGWSHPKGNVYPTIHDSAVRGQIEGEEVDFEIGSPEGNGTLVVKTRFHWPLTIDFAEGIALGELHRRLKTFALEARAFKAP